MRMRLGDFSIASLRPSSARLTLYGFVTLNLEHVAHELSVFLVVFNDENQLASHLCFGYHFLILITIKRARSLRTPFAVRLCLICMDRQGEGERTALAYLALDPDSSSMQFDKLLGES
jgi:hypothetical protein